MRLFAALELPGPVVATLAEWARGAARDGLRLLPPESLHVTLAFLGERPDEEAEPIATAVNAVAAAVPGLSLGDAAWLPPRRPGLLAVDLVDAEGACGRLQGAVAEGLASLGVYAPEKRAFRPHVTVARVRKGVRVDDRVAPIPGSGTFAATSLTLYRSRLSPKGARYDALSRTRLP